MLAMVRKPGLPYAGQSEIVLTRPTCQGLRYLITSKSNPISNNDELRIVSMDPSDGDRKDVSPSDDTAAIWTMRSPAGLTQTGRRRNRSPRDHLHRV